MIAFIVFAARKVGVVAGLDIARATFQLVNPAISLAAEKVVRAVKEAQ